MSEPLYNFEKCHDPRGNGVCFANKKDANVCSCLSDTKTVPCPFFKTMEEVLTSDPEYYHNLEKYVKQYKSFRKLAK